MNYENMSDFEINKDIAKKALDYYECDGDKVIGYIKRDGVLNVSTVFDPCNNSSDAWPIIELIFSKGVTLMINDTGVTTSNLGEKYNGKRLDVNCNPLRAAMIVFLMMQESKK